MEQVNKHAFCETLDVAAVYGGGQICSVRMDKDMDNGSLVGVGDFEKGSAEVRKAEVVSDKVYLVCTPEVVYEAKTVVPFEKFTNAKGTIARAYELAVDDRFAVSTELIEGGKATVGQYVKFEDGKYKMESSATGTVFQGKIYAVVNKGGFTMAHILVEKASK